MPPKTKTKSSKQGRPSPHKGKTKPKARSKYDPDDLTRIYDWARQGLTDEQIAHNLGIARQTFSAWKKKDGDIRSSLKRGRAPVEAEVENALVESARGFEYTEIQVREALDKDGCVHKLTTVTKKRVAPNVIAQIFYLKNRRPKRWKDKQDVEHSGNVTMNFDKRFEKV